MLYLTLNFNLKIHSKNKDNKIAVAIIFKTEEHAKRNVIYAYVYNI